ALLLRDVGQAPPGVGGGGGAPRVQRRPLGSARALRRRRGTPGGRRRRADRPGDRERRAAVPLLAVRRGAGGDGLPRRLRTHPAFLRAVDTEGGLPEGPGRGLLALSGSGAGAGGFA